MRMTRRTFCRAVLLSPSNAIRQIISWPLFAHAIGAGNVNSTAKIAEIGERRVCLYLTLLRLIGGRSAPILTGAGDVGHEPVRAVAGLPKPRSSNSMEARGFVSRIRLQAVGGSFHEAVLHDYWWMRSSSSDGRLMRDVTMHAGGVTPKHIPRRCDRDTERTAVDNVQGRCSGGDVEMQPTRLRVALCPGLGEYACPCTLVEIDVDTNPAMVEIVTREDPLVTARIARSARPNKQSREQHGVR
jgi:hypothetical protein